MTKTGIGGTDASPDFVTDSNAVIRELRTESDRGAALVGAAYLDQLLKDLSRARMVDDRKLIERLLTYPGPLSTTASLEDHALAVGWIGPQVYGDLGLARRIRNQFAHSHKSLRFDDPKISEMCGKFAGLEFARPYRMRKSRDQFLYGMLVLVLQLTELRRQAQKPQQGVDPPIRRVPGPPKAERPRAN